MKIVYVINMFPKLSESFILNEVVELLKNGHDVQIFSIMKPFEEVVHDEVGKYNILLRTNYFSFIGILQINPINFSKYLISIIIQDIYDFRTIYLTFSKPKRLHKKSSILPLNQKIKSQIYKTGRFGIACIRRFILDLKLAYFAVILEKT